MIFQELEMGKLFKLVNPRTINRWEVADRIYLKLGATVCYDISLDRDWFYYTEKQIEAYSVSKCFDQKIQSDSAHILTRFLSS